MSHSKASEKVEVTYSQLFISMLYLSGFTFGGGYVIVTLMKRQFVNQNHWLDENEMIDLIAIAQSSPGAIAINAAIIVGYKLKGLLGVITTVIATILPPFFIIALMSYFYSIVQDNFWLSTLLDGMQASVSALITSVTFEMATNIIHLRKNLLIGIMIMSFVLNLFAHVNVIWLILFSGLIGLVIGHLKKEWLI
ncbi:chromate transporter [Atopobacter phocae]|uniref:chromate transporter n=1 Tax=Atopobacter phocae TaxID=136492 RepID=UPI00046FDADF|nr:chromate transporter [Atopobacter phocae]